MTDEEIFRAGSTTYYWSSKFFSDDVRKDVYKLYSFVRVADNFVDNLPQNIKDFDALTCDWQRIQNGKQLRKRKNSTITRVVGNMYEIAQKYSFDKHWIDAFLSSMRMDIENKKYKTLDDTLQYIYGSAEVIGLMMLSILRPDILEIMRNANANDMSNPDDFDEQIVKQAIRVCNLAKLQSRAMQYINFIRDIDEDARLGRCYFPKTELEKYGVISLDYKGAMRHPPEFREFIDGQLQFYNAWQSEANNGFKYIPQRQRIALRTSVDMYDWTARQIHQNAFVIFDKKVKPSKFRVIRTAIMRILYA